MSSFQLIFSGKIISSKLINFRVFRFNKDLTKV